MLIGDISRHNGRRYPAKTAVISEGRQLSWGAVDERANRLATYLQSTGLKKGDRVAVCARNTLEWPEITYGLAKAGLVLVPVNIRLTPSEIEYIVEDSGCRGRDRARRPGRDRRGPAGRGRHRHRAPDRRHVARQGVRGGPGRRQERRPDPGRPHRVRPARAAVHERHDRSPQGRHERPPRHDGDDPRHHDLDRVQARGHRPRHHAVLHHRRRRPRADLAVPGPDDRDPPASSTPRRCSTPSSGTGSRSPRSSRRC